MVDRVVSRVVPEVRRGGRPSAPEGETNADRFKRLGGARLAATVKAIETLSNCFDRNNYDWSEGQAELVKQHLARAGQKLADRMAGKADSVQRRIEL